MGRDQLSQDPSNVQGTTVAVTTSSSDGGDMAARIHAALKKRNLRERRVPSTPFSRASRSVVTRMDIAILSFMIARIRLERKFHGISSHSQDAIGVFLAVSSTNNSIYLYNVLQLDKGPLETFTGSGI
ncbi:hypothetical protein ACFE04_023558 [Oxalis oulophora]